MSSSLLTRIPETVNQDLITFRQFHTSKFEETSIYGFNFRASSHSQIRKKNIELCIQQQGEFTLLIYASHGPTSFRSLGKKSKASSFRTLTLLLLHVCLFVLCVLIYQRICMQICMQIHAYIQIYEYLFVYCTFNPINVRTRYLFIHSVYIYMHACIFIIVLYRSICLITPVTCRPDM